MHTHSALDSMHNASYNNNRTTSPTLQIKKFYAALLQQAPKE